METLVPDRENPSIGQAHEQRTQAWAGGGCRRSVLYSLNTRSQALGVGVVQGISAEDLNTSF